MPRTPPTGADAELIALLAARGVKVSAYQLERWRAQGLLPRNPYRSLGRGRGRAAQLTPEIITTAELLGRTARQGRKNADLTELVKGMSAHNPAVVRAACITGLTDLAHQTGAQPGRGGPDDDAQARLDAAAQLARTQRHYGGLHNDLRALLAEHGLGVDDIPELPPLDRPAFLELAVRLFSSSHNEVGLDEVADALGAAWNWPHDAVEEMQRSIARSEIEALNRGEDPWDDLPPVHDVHSLIAAVQDCADTELLRAAETVTTTSSYQMMAALGSLAGLAQRPFLCPSAPRRPRRCSAIPSGSPGASSSPEPAPSATRIRPSSSPSACAHRDSPTAWPTTGTSCAASYDSTSSQAACNRAPCRRHPRMPSPESQAPGAPGDGHPGDAPLGAWEEQGR
ncbi:hypothetical protein [Streptomyces mirabilis]|uniref:hypothetical protein n=1 Tax=Streptomyces mirabilis TaxID=68239 RepID=UPI00367CBE90